MIDNGLGHEIVAGKKLRRGYTTGSCATGAAKAAALMLEGISSDCVEIGTPFGVTLRLEVNKRYMEGDEAICSIIKDAGDDPDATDGIEVFARVSKRSDGKIIISGGVGVGRIVRKGIFGEVGEHAINKVPRQMIGRELQQPGSTGYNVQIFVPEGEEIAKKTFNRNIGIEGGISIIGTTGIVQPMSEKALLKTIYLEMDQVLLERGDTGLLLVLGNHGEKLAEGMSLELPAVKISNFIGDSIQYAYNKGFKSIALLGHVGKLSKLSIGAFNTHSRICDTRIEAFVYHLALMGVPLDFLQDLQNCLTAEEAVHRCIDEGYPEVVKRMEESAQERIRTYLKDDGYEIRVIMYSMEGGVDLC
ncbi:cobalt-precorrin-5B (C(1))-methyltransferase CbiD [Gudongella sp. SC589]|jgi:cobalt-precorrin-5B (C1)-methyltransferase|uniref:cobalt-precorrin-5B (C(1))-methyltransferase CbiD n=1 Tax=Gudongella sp. SC589 TaxID=3385990 RepID=UPI003904876B